MEDSITNEFMEQMYYLSYHMGIQPSEVRRLTAYERKWLIEKHLAEKMLEAGRVQRLLEKAGKKGTTTDSRFAKTANVSEKKEDEIVPLVIKTGMSQNANLTEWHNPVGHVLSHSGNTPSLVVKGAVSQTANLQEWQNSAGTVVAAVTADGKFVSPYSKHLMEVEAKEDCRTFSVDLGDSTAEGAEEFIGKLKDLYKKSSGARSTCQVEIN